MQFQSVITSDITSKRCPCGFLPDDRKLKVPQYSDSDSPSISAGCSSQLKSWHLLKKMKPAHIQINATSGPLSKGEHFIGILALGRVNTWLQSVLRLFALYSDPKQNNKIK